MHKIKWIQLSDLHLGNDEAVDTRLMRRRLPAYIANLAQSFDYMFCTGDVKEWNKDFSKAPEYLTSLCEAAGVPLENLYIVPGNHDVAIGGDDRAAVIQKITDWSTDDYNSKVGLISDADMTLLRSGQDAFHTFISEFLGAERVEKYNAPHFNITTEHLNILHLDSTITYGTGYNRDFVIGTRALMDALDECDEAKPTIILTHYSFDFLNQDERNEVENLLNDYHVQLWLAGHEHENLIRWQRDKFIECQCGNLVLQKGARSCFLIGELDLDTGDGEITVHAWYEGKNWEEYPFVRVGFEDNRVFPFQLRLPGDKDPSREDVKANQTNQELLESISVATKMINGAVSDLTSSPCQINMYAELNGTKMENGGTYKVKSGDIIIVETSSSEATIAFISYFFNPLSNYDDRVIVNNNRVEIVIPYGEPGSLQNLFVEPVASNDDGTANKVTKTGCNKYTLEYADCVANKSSCVFLNNVEVKKGSTVNAKAGDAITIAISPPDKVVKINYKFGDHYRQAFPSPIAQYYIPDDVIPGETYILKVNAFFKDGYFIDNKDKAHSTSIVYKFKIID